MKFLIAVIDTDVNTGTPAESVTIDAFNDKLEANGHWIMGAGLEKANIIVNAEGEYMSGFWIIEAELRAFLGN